MLKKEDRERIISEIENLEIDNLENYVTSLDEEALDDKEVVKSFVKRDGMLLRYAGFDAKDSLEVVKEAYQQNQTALIYGTEDVILEIEVTTKEPIVNVDTSTHQLGAINEYKNEVELVPNTNDVDSIYEKIETEPTDDSWKADFDEFKPININSETELDDEAVGIVPIIDNNIDLEEEPVLENFNIPLEEKKPVEEEVKEEHIESKFDFEPVNFVDLNLKIKEKEKPKKVVKVIKEDNLPPLFIKEDALSGKVIKVHSSTMRPSEDLKIRRNAIIKSLSSTLNEISEESFNKKI